MKNNQKLKVVIHQMNKVIYVVDTDNAREFVGVLSKDRACPRCVWKKASDDFNLVKDITSINICTGEYEDIENAFSKWVKMYDVFYLDFLNDDSFDCFKQFCKVHEKNTSDVCNCKQVKSGLVSECHSLIPIVSENKLDYIFSSSGLTEVEYRSFYCVNCNRRIDIHDDTQDNINNAINARAIIDQFDLLTFMEFVHFLEIKNDPRKDDVMIKLKKRKSYSLLKDLSENINIDHDVVLKYHSILFSDIEISNIIKTSFVASEL